MRGEQALQLDAKQHRIATINVEKLQSRPAWGQIQERFFGNGEAGPVLAGISELVEAMTLCAFQTTLAPLLSNGLAMLAVGGFGRRELFPYSDVDILILVERESETAGLKTPLSEFVRLLWDAGLRLSHSVRTIKNPVHPDRVRWFVRFRQPTARGRDG